MLPFEVILMCWTLCLIDHCMENAVLSSRSLLKHWSLETTPTNSTYQIQQTSQCHCEGTDSDIRSSWKSCPVYSLKLGRMGRVRDVASDHMAQSWSEPCGLPAPNIRVSMLPWLCHGRWHSAFLWSQSSFDCRVNIFGTTQHFSAWVDFLHI